MGDKTVHWFFAVLCKDKYLPILRHVRGKGECGGLIIVVGVLPGFKDIHHQSIIRMTATSLPPLIELGVGREVARCVEDNVLIHGEPEQRKPRVDLSVHGEPFLIHIPAGNKLNCVGVVRSKARLPLFGHVPLLPVDEKLPAVLHQNIMRRMLRNGDRNTLALTSRLKIYTNHSCVLSPISVRLAMSILAAGVIFLHVVGLDVAGHQLPDIVRHIILLVQLLNDLRIVFCVQS